jgi:ribosome biogenesis GTPase
LTRGAKSPTAIVVGDEVTFDIVDEPTKEGVIVGIEPRRTKLSRKVSTGMRESEQVVAANVDSLVIVASTSEPPLRPALIDRYLVAAGKGELEPILCINKIDLARSRLADAHTNQLAAVAGGGFPEWVDATSVRESDEIETVAERYQSLGYPVVLTSAKTGEGIEKLRRLLRDKISVFAGHSGVGKSSLLRTLAPDIELKTGEVNPHTGRGRHTTTVAELVHLPGSGYVIDTPGIRQLGLWELTPEDVRAYFVEIARFGSECRFNDCSHTVEPDCAVREAVAEGAIHPHRFESFLKLQNESNAETD